MNLTIWQDFVPLENIHIEKTELINRIEIDGSEGCRVHCLLGLYYIGFVCKGHVGPNSTFVDMKLIHIISSSRFAKKGSIVVL